MEKILIVYYSRTGNAKKVAEALKGYLNCDIEEIMAEKSYAGPIGWVLAGKEASTRINGKIKPPLRNSADYDLVVLGTPIWAWNISSPARGYLAMNREKIKKIAAFCTMHSNEGQAFLEIEKICGKKLQSQMAFLDKDIAANNLLGIKNFLTKK